MYKNFILLCILCISFTLAPSPIFAGSFELSATMKKSLDQLTAAADIEQAKKLSASYQLILTLQQQEQKLDPEIKLLHTNHQTAETNLRQRIKQIDSTKITKLSTQVQQAKDRYQPLYSSYTLLNKQIESARKIKNNPLTPILRAQADQMKLLVQIAREDVRAKEKALKTAKEAASNQMKAIRDKLKAIDPVETKIKAKRTSITALNKLTSSHKNVVNQAIKAKDVKKTQTSLNQLISHINQIIQLKQDILQLEKDIAGIISNAASQLPAS